MGWRSGGLCASGRVLPEYWVNQNGTHYLFGCYTNSLQLGRQVYDYLQSVGDTRFGTFDEQLVPRNLIVLSQFYKGNWTKWALQMPENGQKPGLKTSAPTSKLMSGVILLQHTLHYLMTEPVQAELAPQDGDSSDHHSLIGNIFSRIGQDIASVLDGSLKNIISWLMAKLEDALELADKLHLDGLLNGIVDVLIALRSLIGKILGQPSRDSLIATRIWLISDIGLTVAIGYIQDRAFTEKGFDALDDYDFRDWLRKHGAFRWCSLARRWRPSRCAPMRGRSRCIRR